MNTSVNKRNCSTDNHLKLDKGCFFVDSRTFATQSISSLRDSSMRPSAVRGNDKWTNSIFVIIALDPTIQGMGGNRN